MQELIRIFLDSDKKKLPNAFHCLAAFLIIVSSCNDLDIRIFNISENIDKYYINYYFQTSNKISYIQFFFNKNGEFSTAMPKTFGDINDEKLFNLIEKIKEYATVPTN